MLQHVRGALRRSFSSSASPVHFETLDVFATSRFGGNPLAVVFDEQQRLSDSEMQQVAAEFNYSETTFVLPPRDPERNTAWVRIFSPKEEFPFAGHPNVGTAAVLARRGEIFGRPVGRSVRLEEKAGDVPLDIIYDSSGKPAGAMLTAPAPFAIASPPLSVDGVASSLGLEAADVSTMHHAPLAATTGLPFIIAELASLDALKRSRGVPAAFAQARAADATLYAAPPKVLVYVRQDAATTSSSELALRCRMHRADGSEDAGTGGANAALIGLLASLWKVPRDVTGVTTISAHIVQGVEMGRPSELRAEAERRATGEGAAAVGAVRIGGYCAAVSRGELLGFEEDVSHTCQSRQHTRGILSDFIA